MLSAQSVTKKYRRDKAKLCRIRVKAARADHAVIDERHRVIVDAVSGAVAHKHEVMERLASDVIADRVDRRPKAVERTAPQETANDRLGQSVRFSVARPDERKDEQKQNLWNIGAGGQAEFRAPAAQEERPAHTADEPDHEPDIQQADVFPEAELLCAQETKAEITDRGGKEDLKKGDISAHDHDPDDRHGGEQAKQKGENSKHFDPNDPNIQLFPDSVRHDQVSEQIVSFHKIYINRYSL